MFLNQLYYNDLSGIFSCLSCLSSQQQGRILAAAMLPPAPDYDAVHGTIRQLNRHPRHAWVIAPTQQCWQRSAPMDLLPTSANRMGSHGLQEKVSKRPAAVRSVLAEIWPNSISQILMDVVSGKFPTAGGHKVAIDGYLAYRQH
jgi:hypothetical protein